MQLKLYQVLTPEEAEEMRVLLETQDWQEGKARTEELTGYIKRNKELKPKQDGELVTALSAKITQKIANHPEAAVDMSLMKMTGVKFNKYGDDQPGGEYKRHTDAPWMGPVRTDFTCVLALTDPDTYEGGDHYVEDPLGETIVLRPKQGELMLYETGYAHWVEPVTKGSRISALAWAESQIMGERERALCSTLKNLSRDFEAAMLANKDDTRFRKWFVDIGVVHSGLYRMWARRT